jgi:hypothetical protein
VAVYLAARWRDTRTYRQLYRRELDPGLHEHAVIIIIIIFSRMLKYPCLRGDGDGEICGSKKLLGAHHLASHHQTVHVDHLPF